MRNRLAIGAAALTAGALALGGCSTAGTSAEDGGGDVVELRLVRLFSDCSEEYKGVTDPADAVGECGIITALTNQWNAENPDVQVVTQVADGANYYQQLSTQLGSGDGPDIALMHGAEIPRFAARGVLEPIAERLRAAGADLDDLTPTAADNVTVEDEVYGLPFDLHTILAHVNVDLFREAGLVDAEGQPVLPAGAEEMLAAAEQMHATTGKKLLAVQSDADIGTSWLLASLTWQQGGEVIDADGPSATIDTAEMVEAVELMKSLAEGGYYDPNVSDTNASFLNGEAAVLLNGTWAVNQFDEAVANGDAAFSEYTALPLPTLYDEPAAWANSHAWVVPTSDDAPAVEEAKDRFLAFLYENNLAWARTGHLPVRTSVLESAEYQELPHRDAYADAATIARVYPRVEQIEAFNATLREHALAAYLGEIPVSQALAAAESQATQALATGQ